MYRRNVMIFDYTRNNVFSLVPRLTYDSYTDIVINDNWQFLFIDGGFHILRVIDFRTLPKSDRRKHWNLYASTD